MSDENCKKNVKFSPPLYIFLLRVHIFFVASPAATGMAIDENRLGAMDASAGAVAVAAAEASGSGTWSN